MGERKESSDHRVEQVTEMNEVMIEEAKEMK